MSRLPIFLCGFLCFLCFLSPGRAEVTEPHWIWGEEDPAEGNVMFERRFELSAKPVSATLRITADDFFVLVVNGRFLLFSENWRNLRNVDLTNLLRQGNNTVTVQGRNKEGAAGLLAWLDARLPGNETVRMVTDGKWRTRPGDRKAQGEWKPVQLVGTLGVKPWGNPWTGNGVDHIQVPDGFVVEKLYDVPADQGSWISIANDGEGGFYVSDESDQGVFQVSLQDGQVTKVERLAGELSGAHGLLVVDGALYAHVSGKGLARMKNGTTEFLPGSKGRGEHGVHSLVADPARGGFFVLGGNASKLPEFSRSRAPVWYEDNLIERIWDPGLIKRKAWVAPGGWVCRYDLETQEYEVMSVGFRNHYDLAVNSFGDRFTYDSDEEWDLGMPWYRPTRICLATSGSEFGWRSGSEKWPSYYEDTLPPLVEIGPGSPTGMLCGQGAQFPARYQHAIFALDWTYGTMRAVHLTPSGSAYEATVEDFMNGTPLPLTDAVIAKDGSMVFVTGGRKVASALYRVRYVGTESTEPAPPQDTAAAKAARDLRIRLESFHGVKHPKAIGEAWPHLASEDRYLRFAARIAIESQPVEEWMKRLENESRPQAIITGVIALLRVGRDSEPRDRDEVAELAQQKLFQLDLGSLEESLLLGALRGQALLWDRLGSASEGYADQLLNLFPGQSDAVTQELARLLGFIGYPEFIEPALEVLETKQRSPTPGWANAEVFGRNTSASYGGTFSRYLNNRPPETALRVATFLADFSDQMTEEQALRYFQFLVEASKYQGGAAYLRFLDQIRLRALKDASDRVTVVASEFPLAMSNHRPITVKPPQGPGRVWTLPEALREFETVEMDSTGGHPSGRNLYHATGCIACHQYDGEGGAIGPDLSNLRGKFGVKEILEAIIEPGKAISDQYGAYEVELTSGKVFIGLVTEESGGEMVNVYVGENLRRFPKSEVREIRQSQVSTMPAGLVNGLNADELRDLVFYLLKP